MEHEDERQLVARARDEAKNLYAIGEVTLEADQALASEVASGLFASARAIRFLIAAMERHVATHEESPWPFDFPVKP